MRASGIPGTIANLPHTYGTEDATAGKRAAKTALQRRFGIAPLDNVPMFGVVSRLTPQKGLDLVLGALPELIAGGAQLVLLGAGDADLELGFAAAAARYRGQVGVEIGYDDSLAHLIIGSADVVLLPSRFEPCGLTQLYALRYGALPLVRRVGGLADTVVDANAASLAEGIATGFAFDEDSPRALMAAVGRVIDLFPQREVWQRMIQRAMTRDFSWEAAARQYIDVFRALRSDLPL